MHYLLLSLLAFLCLPIRSWSADFLPGVERILFLGDSITHDGQYVDYFEQFLFTQFPDRRFEVVACGLPSETVSGLSEEGHAGGKFPRPDLHERLDRVLAATKAQLIFACYGMNDGIYLPWEEPRFARFREGILRLREKATLAGAEVIHLTPAVFDPEPIRARVADAAGVNSDHPFANYDDVLTRYSQWLMEPRDQPWRTIDLHGAMRAALDARRKAEPKFTFAADGVHPSSEGHRVMGLALLRQFAGEQFGAFQQTLERHVGSAEWKHFAELIQKRRRLLTEAWLSATGHQRPGMGKGLPLQEAKAEALSLEHHIRQRAAAFASPSE